MFSIQRRHAVAAGVCLAVAAALLFVAGSLTGLLYAANHPSVFGQASLAQAGRKAKVMPAGGIAVTPAGASGQAVKGESDVTAGSPPVASAPAANMPAKPHPGTPAAAAGTSSSSEDSSAAGSATPVNTAAPVAGSSSQAQAAPKEAKTSKSAGEAGGEPATQAAAVSAQQASYAIPLEVQVGSFRQKSHAEVMTQSLKNLGYRPSMSLFTDAKNRKWYVVRVGPYTRWDTATRAATKVAVAENVSPMIEPMQ